MAKTEQARNRYPRGIRRLSRLFLALMLPLLFISTAVRLEMSSPGLYERGYERYHISESTRLDDAQLSEITRQLIDYFNSTSSSPQMQVTTKDGNEFALFHDYELVHLSDVKTLFELNSATQSMLLLLVIVLLLAALSSQDRAWKRDITQGLQFGAVLTFVSLALVSVLFASNFNSMFVGFHLIAFDNSFWLLDPRIDYLVILFPLGFWEDMFLLAGSMTATLAVATFATVQIASRLVRQRVPDAVADSGRR
ncbi:MAG: TIGR01906 family membrane protein [Dehalococcoidia bacterium]|nr:TIGR01906 family membrane protein [Dehalococcoidia bacterium]